MKAINVSCGRIGENEIACRAIGKQSVRPLRREIESIMLRLSIVRLETNIIWTATW